MRIPELARQVLLLTVLLSPIAMTTASDRSDYERARQADTIEAYEAFVSQIGRKPKYWEPAYARLDELRFERAASIDTIDGWNDYLKFRLDKPGNSGWTERTARARAAIDRLVVAGVRAAQQAALAAPTWQSLDAFWKRYPRDMIGPVAAELPLLRFELAEAVGSWRAYGLYEKEYPDSELTRRLKHSVAIRTFDREPTLYAALSYLRDYPQGEQSARLRQWVDADQSAARAGDLRLQWVGGRRLESMRAPTGEVALIGGNLQEVTVTRRPKLGVFLVAQINVFNLGAPRRLLPSQVWLGDGQSRRLVASELVPQTGTIVVMSDQPGVNLGGILTSVRAVFDLPRSGQGGLRLYVDGQPTLRLAEMPEMWPGKSQYR